MRMMISLMDLLDAGCMVSQVMTVGADTKKQLLVKFEGGHKEIFDFETELETALWAGRDHDEDPLLAAILKKYAIPYSLI